MCLTRYLRSLLTAIAQARESGSALIQTSTVSSLSNTLQNSSKRIFADFLYDCSQRLIPFTFRFLAINGNRDNQSGPGGMQYGLPRKQSPDPVVSPSLHKAADIQRAKPLTLCTVCAKDCQPPPVEFSPALLRLPYETEKLPDAEYSGLPDSQTS